MAACGCDRIFLLRVALVCCAASTRAYDLGQDVTLCWVTPVNQSDAQREDCAGANVAFDTTLPNDMEEGQTYSASYSMTVPSARCPSDTVPHANVERLASAHPSCPTLLVWRLTLLLEAAN